MSTTQHPPPIHLPPGSFTLHLVVDSREVKFKNQRQHIQEQLTMHGVNVLTRSLNVGDFIWVARGGRNLRREDDVDGDTPEIVLPYVIERKTTDDLVASIKDSRFKDQKLRLKTCGLPSPIYLIERSPSMVRALEFGMTAIRTAMTQVQVINGFFLKQTGGLDETVQYFVRLTRRLEKALLDKDLYAVPPSITTKDALQSYFTTHPHTPRLHLTFATYQSLNTKSTSYRLQSIWIRQLMTIKGVSGEKAAALAKTYPTMRSLVKALKGKTERDREELVRAAVPVSGRKSIGQALARKILAVIAADVYT
ncbi:restriction endonuclease type II-like protein [Fimicolochytrium jonesii]|uniref:restriction endonuclease type II-like protein n=1 Tax=Fimicolochytrium jonesii TaxID=1396493 RepID=UPI0022FE3B10|nr:restriction endonuclease type II-like protein [Fimicolochytrium jonesii]KAI8819045.1 restriction endonuclease type II-like protein [Fimicolochytrium jonesii]